MASLIAYILIFLIFYVPMCYVAAEPLRKVVKHHKYRNASPFWWIFWLGPMFGMIAGLMYYFEFDEGTDLKDVLDETEE